MQIRKEFLIGAVILLVLILFIPFSGPGAHESENIAPSNSSIILSDALGREITLEKTPEKIGFQFYGVAEALKIVGAWDRVVARDGHLFDEQFYPNCADIPAINPSSGEMNLDYEKIIEIDPDVMIIQKEDWNKDKVNEAIEILEPEIPVIVLDFIDPVTMPENFEKLGIITGNIEEAKEFNDFYTGTVSRIQDKTSSLKESEKPLVFVKAAGYTPDQLCTYGRGMKGWNNILEVSGGKNVASDLSFAFGDVDPEWVIKSDVDILIGEIWEIYYPETFGYMATDPAHSREKGEEMRDKLMKEDLFSGTDAVKKGDVYLIDQSLVGTIRQVVLIPYLAKWLHPNLFGDLNPEQIHQEYLDRFIGADYDLNDVGLFVYPE